MTCTAHGQASGRASAPYIFARHGHGASETCTSRAGPGRPRIGQRRARVEGDGQGVGHRGLWLGKGQVPEPEVTVPMTERSMALKPSDPSASSDRLMLCGNWALVKKPVEFAVCEPMVTPSISGAFPPTEPARPRRAPGR